MYLIDDIGHLKINGSKINISCKKRWNKCQKIMFRIIFHLLISREAQDDETGAFVHPHHLLAAEAGRQRACLVGGTFIARSVGWRVL